MYCKHVQNNQYPPIPAFYFYFVSKPPVSLYPYRFKEICFHLTLPLADRMMKSYGVTILMKRLQQYFQMVNTINIACGSNFRVWMKSYGVTIRMKPLQQYFHMVLFI